MYIYLYTGICFICKSSIFSCFRRHLPIICNRPTTTIVPQGHPKNPKGLYETQKKRRKCIHTFHRRNPSVRDSVSPRSCTPKIMLDLDHFTIVSILGR